MTTIILCGGSGTRLWPLSRVANPKQFAHILPGGSLFEGAVKRNQKPGSGFIVAANVAQSSLAASQLDALGIAEYGLMIEPVGRNTAPAIALACMMLAKDEVVLVVPSDHRIRGLKEYAKAVSRATELAKEGRLVTFGISPSYAETGYGYIETEGERVLSFKEKPDEETAKGYLASGRYYWNSGMFCFKAGTFLSELEAHSPTVFAAAKKAYEQAPSKAPLKPAKAKMEAIPSISIDYAVMEKSSLISCVPCPKEMGWSDLGSYDALYDELIGDVPDGGNATLGEPEPIAVSSTGNLVISSGKRVVLVDVEGLVVVETADAVLVAKRGSTQMVKDAVEKIKSVEMGLL
jgi:mannose-1-phosphate guanylyltransferase